ncbi:MAG: hypothetical protein LHV69_10225 [Elusimicrobia bacterium]|nr:hypothetical protein [Candidatus Obscuribacterium magneticum]
MKETKSNLSLIVRTIARVVARLMLIFGLYVIFHGQITHGGGFAGGVIIALVLILLLLAYGKETSFPKLSQDKILFMAGSGALVLLLIEIVEFVKGQFFTNLLGTGTPYKLWSGGVIPFCNLAISLVVIAGLYGIYVTLVTFRSNEEQK